jgi:hypothetical protein
MGAHDGGMTTIAHVLERFVAGFNDNSLDDVMAFFAEDAVYRPGDGMDVFHFDTDGKITGKFSYANFGLPQFRRDLGGVA